MSLQRHAAYLATVIAFGVTSGTPASAQTRSISFDDPAWDLSRASGAEVVEHLGRQSLFIGGGIVDLRGVELADGVIEVSVSSPSEPGFAFVNFRVQSPGEAEELYLRLHKSGSPDALQYAPSFNGVTSWQLHGPGDGWADVEFDRTTWVPLRIEILGERLRAWVGEDAEPALVTRLRRPEDRGGVALAAAPGAYFSDFRITPLAAAAESAPVTPTAPGTITEWELSPVFLAEDLEQSRPSGRAEHAWQPVSSEPGGLVNLARYLNPAAVRPQGGPPGPPVPVAAYARATLHADRAQVAKLLFGYSDDVQIFLNGRPLFSGRSSFRSRDPLFQGMIGYNDAVFLGLEPGENELVFAVTEHFGGWGIMARLDDPRGIVGGASR